MKPLYALDNLFTHKLFLNKYFLYAVSAISAFVNLQHVMYHEFEYVALFIFIVLVAKGFSKNWSIVLMVGLGLSQMLNLSVKTYEGFRPSGNTLQNKIGRIKQRIANKKEKILNLNQRIATIKSKRQQNKASIDTHRAEIAQLEKTVLNINNPVAQATALNSSDIENKKKLKLKLIKASEDDNAQLNTEKDVKNQQVRNINRELSELNIKLKKLENELAVQKAREKAIADAKRKAEAKVKADAKRKADKAIADANAQAEKKAQADRKAKADAERKAQAEKKEQAERKAQAEKKVRADAEKKAQADIKAKANKVRADADAKAEAEKKAKAQAEKTARAEQAKADAKAQTKKQAEINKLLGKKVKSVGPGPAKATANFSLMQEDDSDQSDDEEMEPKLQSKRPDGFDYLDPSKISGLTQGATKLMSSQKELFTFMNSITPFIENAKKMLKDVDINQLTAGSK